MKNESRNTLIFFLVTFLWTGAFYAPFALTGNSP